MEITLNHNKESFDAVELTIADILEAKRFTHNELIIKINGVLIKHANWKEEVVKDDYNVEIIHLFHGG